MLLPTWILFPLFFPYPFSLFATPGPFTSVMKKTKMKKRKRGKQGPHTHAHNSECHPIPLRSPEIAYLSRMIRRKGGHGT